MPEQRSPATDGDRVIQTNAETDYSTVEIPAKPPTEYHWTQRRAEILQLVDQAGHAQAISQVELADRYGVSQPQISKDLDRLDEFIRGRLAHRRDLEASACYDRAIRGLLDDEEWYQAAKVRKMKDEFLDERIDALEFRRRLDELEDRAERNPREKYK